MTVKRTGLSKSITEHLQFTRRVQYDLTCVAEPVHHAFRCVDGKSREVGESS